jgi:hypothetical protein
MIEKIEEGSTIHQKLYNCSRGLFNAQIWYQFKRFETLCLLNLYHYQHELVKLQEKIDNAKGDLEEEDIQNLRRLLREYSMLIFISKRRQQVNRFLCLGEAIKCFKEISQLNRPPIDAREDTVNFLSDILQESYYQSAGDARSMVDLAPGAFGVEADPVRVFLHKRIDMDQQSLRSNHSMSPQELLLSSRNIQVRVPPGRPAGRPPATRISPTVDILARLTVSLIGGAFLLVPMSILTFVKPPKYQLLTVALFVLVFAIAIALGSEATNHQLLAATAAYSAVLVVFIAGH